MGIATVRVEFCWRIRGESNEEIVISDVDVELIIMPDGM